MKNTINVSVSVVDTIRTKLSANFAGQMLLFLVAHVGEPEFITKFFGWLSKTLSRLAEPLLSLCVIYAIIQRAVPAISSAAVMGFAMSIMLGAPEIILPGAFILAIEKWHTSRAASSILIFMCLLFSILTGLTITDLLVWHMGSDGFNHLMLFRAIVSIAYSVIFQIITYRSKQTEHLTQMVKAVSIFEKLEEFSVSIAQIETENESRIRQLESGMQQQILSISTGIQQFMDFQNTQLERIHSFIESTFNDRIESIESVETGFQEYLAESLSPIIQTLSVHAEALSILPALTSQLGQIEAATQFQIKTVTEEFRHVKVTLEQHARELPKPFQQQIALPTIPRSQPTLKTKEKKISPDFDIKTFVFSCLTQDANITLEGIRDLAMKEGNTVSIGSISNYRRRFFEGVETENETTTITMIETENETPGEIESVVIES